jgi:hypothetical protein
MPGKKDYILIKVRGIKMHEQKLWILSNLKELYSHFKNFHPGVKERFLNFAFLPSRICTAEGTSGAQREVGGRESRCAHKCI